SLPLPPPTPTLSPYTTLFRSKIAGHHADARVGELRHELANRALGERLAHVHQHGDIARDVGSRQVQRRGLAAALPHPQQADPVRSEEHTSELQSRFDLVCRLL